jgi:hypothetical protein
VPSLENRSAPAGRGKIISMWALLRGFADGLAITAVLVACAPVIVVVAPAAGVFALLWWLMDPLKADRRRRLGLCVGCGYDLTGNVSGVCPECGPRRSNAS